MKLCRFDQDRIGVVVGSEIADVTAIIERLPAHRYPLPRFDPLIAALGNLRADIESLAHSATRVPIAQARLLSPVANPGKIIAAPVNYQKHLEEARADAGIHHHNPGHTAEIRKAGLFLKATSAAVGPSEGITLRHADRRVDHEVELVAVIGSVVRSATESNALDAVAGYCVGLDMSVRGSEDRSFRKSVDSFAVLGPWLVTPDECADVGGLDLSIEVNGERRQAANTRDLILGVAQLIEYASSMYTLYPGDIIMTGTPEGVGPVQDGDLLTASVRSVGTMQIRVRAASHD